MRTLLAGGSDGDEAKMNLRKRNVYLGYLALICTTLLGLASPAAAFDAPSRIERSLSLSSQCGLYAFVRNLNGGLASVRVRPIGSGSAQTQAAGGASYFNGGISTIFSAVTAANLEANCSLTDVTNLVQQGAAGAYATQGYMGVAFEATRTSDGDRYAYQAEISGLTATNVTVSQTLVNSAPTITLGSASGPDGSGNYTVTATLSESSSDFTASSLTLTNATATVSGSGSSYSIVLDPVSDGAVSASVPKGAFTDSEGLENWFASNEVAFLVDTTPPTVSIGALSGPAINGLYSATITLSKTATDFTVADLTLTNATATLSGSGTNYTAVLTPTAEGTIALSVEAARFTDAAGYDNTASNQVTATYGITPPVANFVIAPGTTYSAIPAIAFFTDISTIDPTALEPEVWTWDFGDGTSSSLQNPVHAYNLIGNFIVQLTVCTIGVCDTASQTISVNSGVPNTVSLSGLSGTVNATTQVTARFDTAIDPGMAGALALADFSVSGATLSNLSAASGTSPEIYTFDVTPDGAATISLSLPAEVVRTAGNNANEASNTLSATHDATAPTVTIGAFTGPLNGDQTAEITLSEASTDFTLADLTLTNATATLSGGGTNYTAVLTPLADGPVVLSVAPGTFSDAAGNVNALASNEVTTAYDGTAPIISISAFTGPLNGNQTAKITLSEASTDFDLSDLTLTNATATLSGSGTSYTAVLTPVADGPVALSVAAGTFNDAAGNVNATASNEVTMTYDATAPSVSISSSNTTVSGAATIDIAVSFSEAVIGFTASDISVSNGSVTTLSGRGADYLATIKTSGKGDTEISVPAAIATDVAGNANTASNTLSISNAVVEETQKVIAQFMQSRATQLIASQPNLTGFLSGSNTGALDVAVTRGRGDFDLASAPGADNGVWARLNGSWTHEGSRKTRYAFGVIGSHVKLSPNLLVGGMIEFDYLSQEEGAVHIDGHGWLIGPYFVARSPAHPLFFEGMFLYGQTKNDISPFGTYSDRFETQRLLAQFKVTGEIDRGRTIWMPSVQLSYTSDTQRAYTDGLGNLIPEQGLELIQAELGLDLRHQVRLPRSSGALELTGGLAIVGSSTKGSGYASLVVPEYEGGRGKVKAGVNYTLPNKAVLAVDTFYDGIGTAGYESFGVQFGFNLAF